MDYRVVFAPEAQAQRDDIRPGLRITHYKKSAIIAFAVSDLATSVGNAS
jgi:toxin ParE1/3/4